MRCNSEALQSGVVLVDLPGFWDSNAARESVAREYSKADVLWIVAPMQRAVDDKLARGVLINQLDILVCFRADKLLYAWQTFWVMRSRLR